MKYFALIMSVLYVAAGAMLLFDDTFLPQVRKFRFILGGVLLGYGILRGIMWRQKDLKSRREHE